MSFQNSSQPATLCGHVSGQYAGEVAEFCDNHFNNSAHSGRTNCDWNTRNVRLVTAEGHDENVKGLETSLEEAMNTYTKTLKSGSTTTDKNPSGNVLPFDPKTTEAPIDVPPKINATTADYKRVTDTIEKDGGKGVLAFSNSENLIGCGCKGVKVKSSEKDLISNKGSVISLNDKEGASTVIASSDPTCKEGDVGCDPASYTPKTPSGFCTDETAKSLTTETQCAHAGCDWKGDCKKKEEYLFIAITVIIIAAVGYYMMTKKK